MAGKTLFYGVTADPIHWGHILLPQIAMNSLGYDRVIYSIVGSHPQKHTVVEYFYRDIMLVRALYNNLPKRKYHVSFLEQACFQLTGLPSYTIDSLDFFNKVKDCPYRKQLDFLFQFGGWNGVNSKEYGMFVGSMVSVSKLNLLIGSDQALSFKTWKDWQRIEDKYPPFIILRGNDTLTDVSNYFGKDMSSRVLDLQRFNISSTILRGRIKMFGYDDAYVKASIPCEALSYMKFNNLYL